MVFAASDAVPSIAPAGAMDREFLYHFSCFVPTLKSVRVDVDTEDTNNESNELNNSMTISLWCS